MANAREDSRRVARVVKATCRPPEWLVNDDDDDDGLVGLRRRFDRLAIFCRGLTRERDAMKRALDEQLQTRCPQQSDQEQDAGGWSRGVQVIALALVAFIAGRSLRVNVLVDFFLHDY